MVNGEFGSTEDRHGGLKGSRWQLPVHERLGHRSVGAAAGQVGRMAEGAVQVLFGFHHGRARLGTGAAQHGALGV